MKGISHFVSGIAAATFMPGVVEQAAAGSLLPVIGGIFGILPDTLDFKFTRYFERAEAIDPDPLDPDPQMIADKVADAINRAFLRQQEVRVRLLTMKLGPDLWRQYTIRFDAEHSEVVVRIGPTVNTSQMPYARSEIEDLPIGRAKIDAPIKYTYDGEIKIDIFGGPSFAFKRRAAQVEIDFLPWHRSWSHSLVLAAFLGLSAGLLIDATLGWVIFTGMAVHILEDQLGYLGSNLLWPLGERRSGGLRLMHAGDPIPNFVTVWAALVLILFNLDRFTPNHQPFFQPATYLLFALVIPAGVLLVIYFLGKRRRYTTVEAAKQADILEELVEIGT